MIKAAMRAIASYLPERELTNEELAQTFGDWTADKILEKTGIRSRRIAGENECSSDLGVRAAERLFAETGIARQSIDYLLFCTQSPDYFLPTTACLVQDRLGLSNACGAIDFNQGCSGFVYGLSLAKGLIESGTASNVLLITAETYSKFVNPRDRSVRTIFGDAAAATLITGVESDRDLIGPFVFGTDGRGAGNLIVRAGGMREPPSESSAVEHEDKGGNWRSDDDLYMNGPEIFTFTLKAVPPAIDSLLARAAKTKQDVDFYVLHQANRFMLEKLRNKLGIPEDRFCIDMEDCGNTVSSTIPIALERAKARGRLASGMRAMLVGFGVGYSWSAGLMEVV